MDIFDIVLAEQKKILNSGFKWPGRKEAINKVQEELLELLEAFDLKDEQKIKEEFGDLLLIVTTLSLYLKLDLKSCLADAFEKFEGRYKSMKILSSKRGVTFSKLSSEMKSALWVEVKK
mgnify:CR=1 FL=1